VKIAVDAGHGYRDPGACWGDLKEAVLNEQIAERIGHYVRLAGHESVFTRTPVLIARAVTAVRENCDAFVCIHCNSSGNPSARGTEAYVRAGDKRSEKIAERVLAAVLHHWNESPPPNSDLPFMTYRGVKPDTRSQYKGGLAVLRGTYQHMPAVLWEVGFISNGDDRELLTSPIFIERVSCEFANALILQLDLASPASARYPHLACLPLPQPHI
jgi:N-acetylmuramoyl-L-alanine amidase